METATGKVYYYRLAGPGRGGAGDDLRASFSIKILLETALRNWDEFLVTERDIVNLATWNPQAPAPVEIPFHDRARHHAGLHQQYRQSVDLATPHGHHNWAAIRSASIRPAW